MTQREEPHDHDDDVCSELPAEVFASELTTIAARREAAGLPPLPELAGGKPSVRRGLVGLALSGGGFDEIQFGAYRALGFHIGGEVVRSSRTAGLPGFAPAVSGPPPAGTLVDGVSAAPQSAESGESSSDAARSA